MYMVIGMGSVDLPIGARLFQGTFASHQDVGAKWWPVPGLSRYSKSPVPKDEPSPSKNE